MILLDNVIDLLGASPAERVVYYILRHTDGDTKIFSGTYQQIQDAEHVSSATVARVFKLCEQNGTLIRAGMGKWFVPAVIGYEPEDEYSDLALLTEEGLKERAKNSGRSDS